MWLVQKAQKEGEKDVIGDIVTVQTDHWHLFRCAKARQKEQGRKKPLYIPNIMSHAEINKLLYVLVVVVVVVVNCWHLNLRVFF